MSSSQPYLKCKAQADFLQQEFNYCKQFPLEGEEITWPFLYDQALGDPKTP